MRSKWLTFAVAATLGLFASLEIAVFGDDPSETSSTATAAESLGRQRAQDLLQQSMAELRLNRFVAARRLAKQAKEIGATYSLFDIRPEQVLAEIDRRERYASEISHANVTEPASKAGPTKTASSQYDWAPKNQNVLLQPTVSNGSVKPAAALSPPVAPAAGASNENSAFAANGEKERAIELLDKGLLALAENRCDDAERFAHEAAQLHVTWGKYDYRPDNLLDEARVQRAAKPELGPVATSNPIVETPKPATASTWDAVPEPAVATKVSSPSTAEGATSTPPAESRDTREVAGQAAPQQTVSAAEQHTAAAVQPTEALLEQAIGDLHAGRDESARTKIEGALKRIHDPQPAAAVTNAANAAGAGNAVSPVSSASNAQVFFPSRKDEQRNVVSSNGHDSVEMMKPLHDRFMGDEPIRTQMSSPSEQRLREPVSQIDTMNPAYPPKQPFPSMSEATVTQTAYESPATRTTVASTPAPKVQTSPNAAAISPQVGGLEKMSEPVGPSNLLSPPIQKPAPAVQPTGTNAPPIAPPITMDGVWTTTSRRRYPPPSTAPSDILPTPDQQRPGYFRKLWNAIKGE